MDDVTSMSLIGSRMAIDHSLTHSILINLFIKLELSNFLLPPLPSIVFVQECSVVLRKVFDEGRRITVVSPQLRIVLPQVKVVLPQLKVVSPPLKVVSHRPKISSPEGFLYVLESKRLT